MNSLNSDDSDTDGSQQSRSRFGPKKKSYSHKFSNEWLEDKNFRLWLAPSKKSPLHFHCKFCNDDNKGGKSAVRKHMNTSKHQRAAKSIKNVHSIESHLGKATTLEKKTKEAEMRIAMFISEHNISFRTSDHLVQLIKSIDSDAVSKISCNRTKATAIVNNVLGATSFENLIDKIRSQKFTMLIDESTDKSATKNLAIVVRLLDFDNYIVRDQFLSLIEICDGSALGIYNAIINFFNKHSVPYKNNLVGFAADGASTMFGRHHSVKTLLKNDIPNLYTMKCICHSLALVASYATQKIPDEIEKTVREIYTYFMYSFKRQTQYEEFQSFCEIKPHKILKPCQTRWLSLHVCIQRILEQLQALKLYFQSENNDNKANEIFKYINDPHFELYMNFLDFALPLLTSLNILFQSEQPQIHKLYSKMSMTYKTILECYIKPDYLRTTDLEKVQYRVPENFLKSEDIYIGGKCMALISNNSICKLSHTEKAVFINNCLNFYVECAHQLFQRFPFHSNEVRCLKSLSFLDPQNIKNVISIGPAAQYFESVLELNLNDLDREWRLLRNIDINFELEIIEFWRIVNNLKDPEGNNSLPLVMKLVNFLIILPHSSACVERIFSSINLNKTKIRNKLSTISLSGILHSKNMLNNQQKSCYNFNIDNKMMMKHNNSMY